MNTENEYDSPVMDTGASAPERDGGEVFGSSEDRRDPAPLLSQGKASAGSRSHFGRL
jgi:hypothetical protein